jgi:hypothetical protein
MALANLQCAGLGSKAAQWAATLKGVGVAGQTVVFDAGQGAAAYSMISTCLKTSSYSFSIWSIIGGVGVELTAIGSRRNAAASRAVDVADILLEGGVGRAARAVGNGAVVVLGPGCGSDKGDDGEKSECELHVG